MGQFMFSCLTVDGSMQTDFSLALTLHLLDVILDDTRVNKHSENKVVRYMERKKDNIEDENLQNTIDVKYKQTLTGSDGNFFSFWVNVLKLTNYCIYTYF